MAYRQRAPALDLRPLKGNLLGSVCGLRLWNWPIIFGFVGKDGDAVDYEDYH